MATLHDEILITDLEENLHDDPYGTAMYGIRNLLSRALSAPMNGVMNGQEFENLKRISVAVMMITEEKLDIRNAADVT